MKKEELPLVYGFASCIWSSFRFPKDNLEEKIFDTVWYGTLKNFSLKLILTAMQEYATANDFCNITKIGMLCKKYNQMLDGTYIDEETTIAHIQSAVSWDNCRENFEKLSPFEQGPHMLARWSRDEAFSSVILSNLRKTIRNKLEFQREQEFLQISNIQCESLAIDNKKQLSVGDNHESDSVRVLW